MIHAQSHVGAKQVADKEYGCADQEGQDVPFGIVQGVEQQLKQYKYHSRGWKRTTETAQI